MAVDPFGAFFGLGFVFLILALLLWWFLVWILWAIGASAWKVKKAILALQGIQTEVHSVAIRIHELNENLSAMATHFDKKFPGTRPPQEDEDKEESV